MTNEPKFTHREVQILQHLQLGDTNKVIGRALGISECTVKIHIRNILSKGECQQPDPGGSARQVRDYPTEAVIG